MPRFRITIEYDGVPFIGWQRQDNGPSIQAALEAAVLQLTGEPAVVYGAGRTDGGVHARAQIAHFDLSKDWRLDKIRDGFNFYLRPNPIIVLEAEQVEPDFHSRFDAVYRHYVYQIVNRHSPLTFGRELAWHVKRPLDVDAMNEGAQHLIGKHDFTTFRSTHCQSKSPVKTMGELSVVRTGDTIEILASARSFLHNQIRSIAGSLKLVGEGKWQPEQMAQALTAVDRQACGPVAPAHGLYLLKVDY